MTVPVNTFLDGYPQVSPQVKSSVDMSNDIGSIAEALSKAQGELESAKKGEQGYGYKYSDLATVIESAKPTLTKYGLAVIQLVGSQTDKSVNLVTILTHSSGQYFKSTASLPLIEMKGCNAAQNAGASLSYLRRYAYQAIIGQPSEDNDASSNGISKPEKTTSFSKPAAKEEKAVEATSSVPRRTKFKGASNESNELDL